MSSCPESGAVSFRRVSPFRLSFISPPGGSFSWALAELAAARGGRQAKSAYLWLPDVNSARRGAVPGVVPRAAEKLRERRLGAAGKVAVCE